MAALMLDFGALPDEQRNTLWLCMLHPRCPTSTATVSALSGRELPTCARLGGPPDDTALGERVEELTSHSTEFARLWAKRCVRSTAGAHSAAAPRVGPLTVEYEVLTPLQDPDQRSSSVVPRTRRPSGHGRIAREAERPGSRRCNQHGSGGDPR